METLKIAFYVFMMFFVIVAIHEWGHYYFAKRAGILVREFAIGFGPKMFSYKRGETQFTFRLLPFGGYARMAGEDPDISLIDVGQTICVRIKDGSIEKIFTANLEKYKNVIKGEVLHVDLETNLQLELDVDGERMAFSVHPQALIVGKDNTMQIAPKDRWFSSKTVGQRAMAIFAGPLMNFVLAFALFIIYIQVSGVPVENPSYIKIAEVSANGPAQQAGLKEGDIIKSINGTAVGADQQKLISLISESKGKSMDWMIERGGQEASVSVTPADVDGSGNGKVGISLGYPTRQAGFIETLSLSGKYTIETSKLIFKGLQQLVQNFALDDIGGPVRTIEVTGEIAKSGLDRLIYWSAMISINLGIFNLLPIPALDGSRLIFLGIEAVRGRPLNPNREGMVHFIGFAMLFVLMLAVTYNDILRLINR
ncbi:MULTISPECIES: RIP metalloprotease RseP [Paenibacillus]|uniref:RIP metalloprotease RseP n=1 Tax=Paenibacillus TaxID=44249 RepID=UPI001F2D5238|nr:RIP metalloprotease RseP [Paenibacillus sp. JJ-223]CAH1211186.1 Regulator of sigma-W protease RasP [Paenibacillus sp. JJ-223]